MHPLGMRFLTVLLLLVFITLTVVLNSEVHAAYVMGSSSKNRPSFASAIKRSEDGVKEEGSNKIQKQESNNKRSESEQNQESSRSNQNSVDDKTETQQGNQEQVPNMEAVNINRLIDLVKQLKKDFPGEPPEPPMPDWESIILEQQHYDRQSKNRNNGQMLRRSASAVASATSKHKHPSFRKMVDMSAYSLVPPKKTKRDSNGC